MGYKLKLTRDTDLYVLTIVDSKSGYRTEVRGKSNYETDGYDSNDALHKLLDVIGKSANISELMNSVCVSTIPSCSIGKFGAKSKEITILSVSVVNGIVL